MIPFLQQVARHYLATADDLTDTLFVFPSRRAVVFFGKFFAEEVASNSGEAPVFAPMALSMDDFFARLCPMEKADRITQLLELYDCYAEICRERGMDPGLQDDFIFWGDMILADFADVDKYLVDAHELFRNVSELKSIEDDFSYLTQTQKNALEHFLSMFHTEGDYKTRFLRLWHILSPLYDSFNAALASKGISSEGAMYRWIAQSADTLGAEQLLAGVFPQCRKVVFCGLNALNECEKKVMTHLHSEGMAEFCWDYVDDWIRDPANKSSKFMEQNIKQFPQAFQIQCAPQHPRFEVISLPSAVGQTRLLSDLLCDEAVPKNERTAVVLPDESLLLPLLNSIPPQVQDINVTMGFPMAESSFFCLMDNIAQMQLNLRKKDGNTQFYHRYVRAITGNNVFCALADDLTREKIEAVRKEHRYYIDVASLVGTPLLDVVFRGVEASVAALEEYLLQVLDFIGKSIAQDPALTQTLALEMDFAMEYCRSVNLLSEKDIKLRPDTYLRLLKALLQTTSIPFTGEPLKGVQIMGPLETRALDFDNVFILSCNEGVFPRRNVASSFIPRFMREGFGLPTYEYQDAVWAYYFYRLAQRPSKMWLMSDSRSEGLKSGEQSRYIKQLQYHFAAPLVMKTVTGVPKATSMPMAVEKTQQHIDFIKTHPLSASAIKSYSACPAKFYYSFIEELREEEEVSESLDAIMTGNVYHHVMERLYRNLPGRRADAQTLGQILKDRDALKTIVDEEVMKELRSDQICGRDIITATIINKYVVATIERDIEQANASSRGYLTIENIELPMTAGFGEFKLKGFIDRIDNSAPLKRRVVDYKTGKILKEDFDLQFFIYDWMLLDRGKADIENLENCLYSTRLLSSQAPENVPVTAEWLDQMKTKLSDILALMTDINIPFQRTDDLRKCEKCNFRTICAR